MDNLQPQNAQELPKQTNKKIFILAGTAAIAILVLGLYLVFRNKTHNTSVTTIRKNTIIQTQPMNHAVNVGLNTFISFTFKDPLQSIDQNSLKASISPSIPLTLQILPDNKTVEVLPTQKLVSGLTYTIHVSYASGSYSWSFTTIPTPTQTLDQLMQKQTQSDRNFGQWQQNLYQNYPWYNSLPLQSDSYFVYFDVNSKTFIAELYPQKQSSLSIEEQTTQLKQQVIDKLQGLGIQTNNYQFSWSIKPR